jgi:hypothetical protein
MNRILCLLFAVQLVSTSLHAQEVMNRGRYSLKKAPRTVDMVGTFDIDAVRTNRLQRYELQRKSTDAGGERRMVVYDKANRNRIDVRIKLSSSVTEAETDALDLLNSMSGIFTNGSPSGQSIGDSVWHHVEKANGATTIVFLRKNLVISLFAEQGPVAETLAAELDADILAGKRGFDLKRGP